MPAAWRPAAAAGRTAAGAEARAGAAARRAARAHTGDKAPSACIAPEGKGGATLARALRAAAPAPAGSAWATRARLMRRGWRRRTSSTCTATWRRPRAAPCSLLRLQRHACAALHAQPPAFDVADAPPLAPPVAQLRARAQALAGALAAAEERAVAAEAQRDALAVNISRIFRVRATAARGRRSSPPPAPCWCCARLVACAVSHGFVPRWRRRRAPSWHARTPPWRRCAKSSVRRRREPADLEAVVSGAAAYMHPSADRRLSAFALARACES